MRSQDEERLVEFVEEASAESVQTLACPRCKGGLNIQLAHGKRIALSVDCETCRWRVIVDRLPHVPPWVAKLGPKIRTQSEDVKLPQSDGEKLALHRSRRKTK